MLRGAGIENNSTRLLLQGLQNVVQFIGAVAGALVTDRVGRRPQLLVSTAIIVVLFAIVTALNATNVVDGPDGEPTAKSGVTARAQIAMIFLFGFVYSAGWTPNQAMYPVECLRYESRAKGMGMNNVSCLGQSHITCSIALANKALPGEIVLRQHRFLLQHLRDRNRVLRRRLEILFPIHLLGHVRVHHHLLPVCGDEQAHAGRVDGYLPGEESEEGVVAQGRGLCCWGRGGRDYEGGALIYLSVG